MDLCISLTIPFFQPEELFTVVLQYEIFTNVVLNWPDFVSTDTITGLSFHNNGAAQKRTLFVTSHRGNNTFERH